MKVSHVENMDTHAVIGGTDVQAFGMSDSAEFFTILSDTLYSDKILAVAREIICNGWDSHIMAGVEDKPLDITLNDSKLVIRDYGTGITHDLVRQIYCIYGESTKTKSDKETGGFGLGSKAPFAYTDHFTVTNWHDGIKTVYAISRGSVETGGKPDIRTIVSVPDEDGRGIEVSMPIKNHDDHRRFNDVIKNVVYFGGINALKNEEPLESLDYSLYKDDFVLVSKPSTISVQGNIFIKYGSVVYPIQRADEYAEHYDIIQRIFNRNGYARDDTNKMVIFTAAANTIAVTPSREGLSQTEQTRDTISRILARFIENKNDNSSKAIKELVKLGCDYSIENKSFSALMNCITGNSALKSAPSIKALESKPVFTYEELGMYCILTHGTGVSHHQHNDLSFTLEYIKYLSVHDKERITLYRWLSKYLDRNSQTFYLNTRLSSIITRYRLDQLKNILGDDDSMLRITSRTGSGKQKMKTLAAMEELPATNFDKLLLAGSDYAVSDYIDYSYTHYIAVRPSTTKAVRERVLEKLTNSGISFKNLLDVVQERDYCTSGNTIAATPARPKGYIKLSDCISQHDTYNSNMLDDVEKDRIEEPKYVVYNRSDDGHHIIDGWGSSNFNTLLNLYPDTVVTRNQKSYQKQIDKGALNPINELFNSMKKHIDDNPNFLSKLDYTHFNESYYNRDLSTHRKLFKYCPALRKKMGIMLIKSKKDQQFADLFYSIYKNQNNRRLSYDHTKLMKDHFNAVDELRSKSKPLELIKSNRLLSALKLNDLLNILESGSDDQKAATLKLLNIALKGV